MAFFFLFLIFKLSGMTAERGLEKKKKKNYKGQIFFFFFTK